MSDIASILEGIDPQSFARLERSTRRARRTAVLVNGLTFVGLLAAGVWALWRGWQSGNWLVFWFPPFFAVLDLVLLALPAANVLPTLRFDGALAGALRKAAVSGDDRLAPPATGQMSSSPDGMQDAAMASSLRIRSSAGSRRLTSQYLYTFLPLIYVLFLIELFPVLSGNGADSSPIDAFLTSGWLYAFMGALFAVALCFSLWRSSRLRFTATADDIGVTWQRDGAQYRIAWGEVRSFFLVRFSPAGGSFPQSTYVLDGGETVLTWSLPLALRSKTRLEVERFRGTFAARAGKPLRDLSSLASSLAVASGKPIRLRALGVPTESLGLPEDLTPPSRWRWRPTRRGAALGSVALALLVVLIGSGIWLQQYQPTYRAGLPSQVHGERPLYSDALGADDGSWHPAAGSFGASGLFTFSGGAYQLSDPFAADSSDSTSISAWAPGDYGDAAVEVTASQTGSTDYDGVGIVARADAFGGPQLSFTVDTLGNWSFSECNDGNYWYALNSGSTGAAHQGDGAPNTLLLIMRGDSYLYYLNGQFVGSYTDSYEPTPRSGRVGVVVLDATTSGAFSDFAVYPVQPPSSFLWI